MSCSSPATETGRRVAFSEAGLAAIAACQRRRHARNRVAIIIAERLAAGDLGGAVRALDAFRDAADPTAASNQSE